MKRLAMLAVSVATALSLVALPTASAVAAPQITVPVVGSVAGGGVFTGSFTPTKFITSGGGVAIVGTLTGTVTSATGAVGTILKNITLPVTISATTCQILHLDLGPLHLNLLGLEVDLSRIVLDITAQRGSGQLLGNLLCAVAGLLDNPSGLAKLLNDILAAL